MLFHFACLQTLKLLKELRIVLHWLKGKENKITTNAQVLKEVSSGRKIFRPRLQQSCKYWQMTKCGLWAVLDSSNIIDFNIIINGFISAIMPF